MSLRNSEKSMESSKLYLTKETDMKRKVTEGTDFVLKTKTVKLNVREKQTRLESSNYINTHLCNNE